MSDPIYVTAIFHVREDCIDQAIVIFNELAVPTRAEPGCVDYGFYQDGDNATLILAIETWQNHDAFRAHLASPHFKSAFDSVSKLLSAEPVIHQCKKII